MRFFIYKIWFVVGIPGMPTEKMRIKEDMHDDKGK